MASDEHREIERKYDVDWSTPLPSSMPDLPGVQAVDGPVEHELTAVYVDTEDLALAAAGVTLRRRTGGSDDGWHLKLPVADGERLELRRPPGRSANRVPVQLERLVRVHMRGRALQPVATLKTRRSVHRLCGADGVVLAEVCDDRVTAQIANGPGRSWREWEVELAAGDDGLLEAVEQVLLDAGAQPAKGPSKLARALGDRLPEPAPAPALPSKPSAGAVLTAYLAEQVAELKRRDPDVRRDAADAVHKMRVALRRIRSALATYRPVLDRRVTDPIRDELRWLGLQLSAARDADVLREHLLGRLREEPAELVPDRVPQTIDTELKAEYRAAQRRAVEALDDQRYLRLLDVLDRLVAAPPLTDADGPADRALPRMLRRDWKRLRKRVDSALQAPDGERDAGLHEARKAAKRVRYAAESAGVVLGGRAEKLAGRAKNLQNILGAHQDAVVFRPQLRRLAVQAQLDGGNAFSYGRLHALEQCRAEQAEREFVEQWAKESKRYPKGWMR